MTIVPANVKAPSPLHRQRLRGATKRAVIRLAAARRRLELAQQLMALAQRRLADAEQDVTDAERRLHLQQGLNDHD